MKLIIRSAKAMLLLVAAALLTGCGGHSAQTFPSAEAASLALVDALRTSDTAKLKTILGSDAEKLINSGDEVADRGAMRLFVEKYDQKHSLTTEADGSVSMVVGDTDWPLPIPIVQDDQKHTWYFDTEAGQEEMINRRVGRNELATINVCRAIVDAQYEYAESDPDHDGIECYASKFMSDPGRKNGLYWPTDPGAPESPLGPLVATASGEGYTRDGSGEPQPYHGYRYRMLTRQGSHTLGGARDYIVKNKLIAGFGVVAYPAEYGASGVMTFITNQDGKVYQRDLGKDTAGIAGKLNEFDPGPEWTLVEAPAPEAAKEP